MVRRNRGAVVAASLVIGSLVLGIAGTSMGMVRAVRAERLAEQKAHVAVSVNEFLHQDLLAAVPAAPGADPDQSFVFRQVLDVATDRLEAAAGEGGRFAHEPLVEAQLRGTLSDTYRRIGAYAEAEPHARRAVEICTTVLGDEHPDSLRAKQGLATVFVCGGRFDEAEALQRDTMQMQIRVLGENHPDTVGSMKELVIAYCGQGRFEEAEPLIARCIEIERAAGVEHHAEVIASAGGSSATAQVVRTGPDDAIVVCEKAIEMARRKLGDDHPTTIRLIEKYKRIAPAPTRTPRAAESEE